MRVGIRVRRRRAAGIPQCELHCAGEGLRNLDARRREVVPGSLRLVRVAAQAGHGLEVGHQLDHPLRAGDLRDQHVQPLLRGDRVRARLGVAVVDDDEGDAAGLADAGEDRDVRLPAALDDRDLGPVGVVAERGEDGREDELLRAALDEDRRAGEEELAPLRVELAHDPERLVRLERLRPDDVRAALGIVSDEHELLETGDVQEGRRVRGVEHLVPRGGELAQAAIEVALNVRPEEELGLLDDEHDAGDVRLATGLECRDERAGAGGLGGARVVLLRSSLEAPRRLSSARARLHEPPAPQAGGEEDDRRRALALCARLRRTGAKRDLPAVDELRLDRDRPVLVTADVVTLDGRRRIEERPHGAQEVRLAGARLADQRRDWAELELDVRGGAVRADPDTPEQRHGRRRYPAELVGRPGAAGVGKRRQDGLQPFPQRLVVRRKREPLAERLQRLVRGEAGAHRGELEEDAARLPEVDRPEVEAVDDRRRA